LIASYVGTSPTHDIHFTHDTRPTLKINSNGRRYVRSEKPIHNDKERWPVISTACFKTSLNAKAEQSSNDSPMSLRRRAPTSVG
jgi:hypothetical protein